MERNKRNHFNNNKAKKHSIAATQERLSQFQRKYPYRFRQVFDLYREGLKKIRAGAAQEAKTSFEKALSIYQDYIPAQNQLAMTYGMLHNYKEALQLAKTVVKLDDKNVFALLQGAIFLYKLGKKKEAERFAKSALIAFHEREGQDPYNDYDMLQKLVEMFSVLRDDKILSNLYKMRKSQLSPMSLYRAALSLSNQNFIGEAISALQSIKVGSEYKVQGELLRSGIEFLINENLPVPKLYAEEGQIEVCLQNEMDEIPLDKLKRFTEIVSTHNTIDQTSAKVNEKANNDQVSILELQDISRILDGYTKDKLITIVKACEISGYSKLNKKGLTELIGERIIKKAPCSLILKDLDKFQKIIDLLSDQIKR